MPRHKKGDKVKMTGKGTLSFKDYMVGDLVMFRTHGRDWPTMVSKVTTAKITVNWLYPSNTM